MKPRRPTSSQIFSAEWEKNRAALENKCLAYSSFAKVVSKPSARTVLYEFKAEVLGAIFRGAQRELKRVPKVRIDRRLKFQGAAVYSVKLRRRLSVHQPHTTASHAFLVYAALAEIRSNTKVAAEANS